MDANRTAGFQMLNCDGNFALSIGRQVNPGDIFVADPHNDCRLKQLTRVNAAVLDRLAVSRPQRFSVRSGAVSVQGWVMRPSGMKATGRRS